MYFSEERRSSSPETKADTLKGCESSDGHLFKGFIYSYPKLVTFDQRLVSLPDYEMLVDKAEDVDTGIPVGKLRYFDEESI